MGLPLNLIKRHVNRLRPGTLFTTRDLLAYGPRHTVDNITSRMVKRGDISRVAFGVFMRPCFPDRQPAPLEIVQTKMRAWGKTFFHDTHGEGQTSTKTALTPERLMVFISGSSSSFKTMTGVEIVLRHAGPRKMKLSASPAGQLGRKLWNEGQQKIKDWELALDYVRLGRDAVTEFLRFYRLLPAWLNDRLYRRRMRHFGSAFMDIGIDSWDMLANRHGIGPFEWLNSIPETQT